MKYKNIIDTHTHSIHSFDGNNTCEELCFGAINSNAIGIAITDHCDIDGMKEKCWDFQDNQFETVSLAKKKFCDKINVYHGVELGQGIFEKELSEEFLNKYDFDIVIGSIHNLYKQEDFYFLDYTKYNIDKLLKEYFEAELQLAEWNKTDTLAHLTYPFRYIIEREKYLPDINQYQSIIDEIYRVLIRNNKALELNVSGLTKPIGTTLPDISQIKRYYDLGGRLITIGSDSHFADKVCENIDKGMDIVKDCGFEYITVFEKRMPKLISII